MTKKNIMKDCLEFEPEPIVDNHDSGYIEKVDTNILVELKFELIEYIRTYGIPMLEYFDYNLWDDFFPLD
jgi:hypothetical protein